jgi:hypothetical protein
MAEPTASPARIGSNSLPELARQIVEAHEAIQNAPKTAYRAIMVGKLLIQAKNHDGQYGKWATWLKENCREMTDCTAQRYMKLAAKETSSKTSVPRQRTKMEIRNRHACRICPSGKRTA